ncbi:MAG: PKD domain-containing protein [Bacteroidetes bacterium]|nr:PKD domain-containing protein [Bacteroidota bacterium]
MAGNVPANNIASWNGSAFDSLGAGVDDYVYTLTAYNCELYAGGNFDTASGIPINNNKIAKWNGTAWSAVGSAITSAGINSLSVYNGDLYVGGTIFSPCFMCGILKWNIPIPSSPNASFFANDSNIQMGSYIKFTNTSTTGTTAQWSFQGGIPASSTDLNPIIYYPNVGTYDVTLIATNCAGSDTLVKSVYIKVDSVIHSIAYGQSTDYINVTIYEDRNTVLPDFSATFQYEIYYYKPSLMIL